MPNLSERLDNLQAALDLANEELATLRDALSATGPKRTAQSRKADKKNASDTIVPAKHLQVVSRAIQPGYKMPDRGANYDTPLAHMVWSVLCAHPDEMLTAVQIKERAQKLFGVKIRGSVSPPLSEISLAGLADAYQIQGTRPFMYQVKRDEMLRLSRTQVTVAYCKRLRNKREQDREAQSA